MIPPGDERDDRMDELLIQGARDYNQPGRVPRDEMWARIAQARAQSGSSASAGGAAVPSAPSQRHWMVGRGRAWLGTALAAGLLLAAGISIGRRMEHGALQITAPTAASPTTRTAKAPAAAPGRGASAADSGGQVASVPSTTLGADSLVPHMREQTRVTQRELSELASSETAGRAGDSAATGSGSAAGSRTTDNDLAYRLVVLQHLAGSEAMITAFRASAHHGAVDAQIASWSKDLLSTTRMLEGSPATQDPTMRRLLEDLDLVITQIVQYTTHGTHDPDELDLIEQSIAKRGVITKLRSTLPPRPAAGA